MAYGQPTISQDPSGIQDGVDLRPADLRLLAGEHGWRLVVLFGSVARGEPGRDVDLAVLPAAVPPLLEQGRWQAELEALFCPKPVDLVLLHDGLAPVTRFEVFRNGVCFFESSAGLFEQERDRAFFLFADSEIFRRQMREVLYDHRST